MPRELADFLVCGTELITRGTRPADFVVDRLIEATDFVLLKGREKKTWKTYLALRLAVARITGGDWLGFHVKSCKPSRVLMISTETGIDQVGRRVVQLCNGLGIDPARVVPFLAVTDEPITMIPRGERDRRAGEADLKMRVRAVSDFNDKRRGELLKAAAKVAGEVRDGLGSHMDRLQALESVEPGTFGLVIVDTLRNCLAGDENSSRDAQAFTRAVRELARTLGCPVLVIHHTNKGGNPLEARSSRGSVEFTGAPDAIISVERTDETGTMAFELRNHREPDPIGYRLVDTADEGARFEVCAPPRGASGDVDDDEVLTVLREHAPDALTVSKVRGFVAMKRGGKPGAKAHGPTIARALASLVERQLATSVIIERTKGEPLQGYRAGTDARPDTAKHITNDSAFDRPFDV